MIIFYADKKGSAVPVGFQGYSDDVADVISKITNYPAVPTPSNNPNSTAFDWFSTTPVTFSEIFQLAGATKVADVYANLGDGSFELFTDQGLKSSIGIVMGLTRNTVTFTYKGLDYYYTKMFAKFSWDATSVLASPYVVNKGVSTINDMLANILACEKRCDEVTSLYAKATNFSYSKLRSPFQSVYLTGVDEPVNFYKVGFKTGLGIDNKPLMSWVNFPSLYTAMKGKPFFQVDEMTVAGERFRPAVLYTPDMISDAMRPVYDKIVLRTLEDESENISTGLNDATLTAKVNSVKEEIPVKRFLTTSVQMPSRAFALQTLVNNGVIVSGDDNPSNEIPRLLVPELNKKTPVYSIVTDALRRYGSAIPKLVVFAQTAPFTNLSLSAKSAGDIDFSTVRIEGVEPPVFIPHVVGLLGAYADNVNQALSNINYKILSCAIFPAENTLTGKQFSDFFYGGTVEEWIPTEPDKPDIPQDNGNGGFNDNPDGGGDGTWSDSGVDAGVGDDPAKDPIYTMPTDIGISGNYEIVKLSNAAMRSLAEQSWTPDGWIANCMKLQGMTRIGDGILSVKACYADIPSTTDANLVAVAGQSLATPIPCTRVQQYTQWKFDPVPIPKYFGSFLDYAPYTQIVVELPFGQPATIPPELVVGKSIEIALRCDVMSETAMYLITNGDRLIAQVPANIFVHIPFGSSEYTQSGQMGMVNLMGQLGKVGLNIATGGLSGAISNMKANPGDAYGGGITPQSLVAGEGISAVGQVAGAATGMMQQAHQMQDSRNITQIDNGGGPGAIGAMGVKRPLVKISRPYVPIPERFYDLNGAPSGMVRKVGDCKGYLEVGAIYGAIKCNTEEFTMITEVLAGGVYP